MSDSLITDSAWAKAWGFQPSHYRDHPIEHADGLIDWAGDLRAQMDLLSPDDPRRVDLAEALRHMRDASLRVNAAIETDEDPKTGERLVDPDMPPVKPVTADMIPIEVVRD